MIGDRAGFLPKCLMEPALQTTYEQSAAGRSDLAETTPAKSKRLQGLPVSNLCVMIVSSAELVYSSSSCVVSEDLSNLRNLPARMHSKPRESQNRVSRSPHHDMWQVCIVALRVLCLVSASVLPAFQLA